jgi:hypothetical protein
MQAARTKSLHGYIGMNKYIRVIVVQIPTAEHGPVQRRKLATVLDEQDRAFRSFLKTSIAALLTRRLTIGSRFSIIIWSIRSGQPRPFFFDCWFY